MNISRYILTMILFLTFIGFGYAALFQLGKEQEIRTQQSSLAASHPSNDPQYEEVAGRSLGEAYLSGKMVAGEEYNRAVAQHSEESSGLLYDASKLREARLTYVGIAVLAVIMLVVLWLPWGRWLDAGAKELHDVGKAAVGAAKTRLEPEESSPRIIGSERFSRFSVADEMLKWKQLRDEGIVTEVEFDEARAKLLGRKD